MDLSTLKPAEGSKHSANFRVGRGHGSGNGKTAGKGHKGQFGREFHQRMIRGWDPVAVGNRAGAGSPEFRGESSPVNHLSRI